MPEMNENERTNRWSGNGRLTYFALPEWRVLTHHNNIDTEQTAHSNITNHLIIKGGNQHRPFRVGGVHTMKQSTGKGLFLAALVLSFSQTSVATTDGRTDLTGQGEAEVIAGTGYGHTLFDSADNKCQHCHNDLYDTWNRSMHAKSWEDPIFQSKYQDFLRLQASKIGVVDPRTGDEYLPKMIQKSGQVCVKCHAPTAFYSSDYKITLKEVGDQNLRDEVAFPDPLDDGDAEALEPDPEERRSEAPLLVVEGQMGSIAIVHRPQRETGRELEFDPERNIEAIVPLRVVEADVGRYRPPRVVLGHGQEVGLLAEVLKVGNDPPGAGDRVGFQDIGIHLFHCRPAVGNAHEVFFHAGNICSRYTPHMVIPLNQWFYLIEVTRP